MYKLVGNKKGFSIVELIVSMAILVIVTVPIMASFSSIAAINLRTKNQQDVDAVMRVIKEEVVDHVKDADPNVHTDSGDIQLRSGSTFISGTNIKVDGASSSYYSSYRYDAKYLGPVPDDTGTGFIKDIHEYSINVKKKDGVSYKNIQSFRIKIFVG